MVGILLLLAVLLRAEWSAVSSLPAATAFPVPPTMQAMMATACGPELVQRSVPTPDAAALRGGQVLVEVEASSVNPVDWKLLQCGWGGHFPSRTGWDLAGVVVAMGPSASSRLKPGDRVWGDICPIFGAWAQFVVVQEAQLGLAPPSLSPRDAATLPLVGMTTLAAYGVTDARGVPQSTWSQKPATLIIGGTGGCGSVGIQLASALGAGHIYATGSDPAWMSSLGADTAWDYRRDNWWQHIQNDTLDVVYDTVGLSVDADYAMAKLRTGGIFVTIAGSTSTHPKPGVAQASIHNWAKNGTTVTVLGGFVNRGELKPTVQEYFPLADVMRAVNVSRGGQVIGKLGIVVKG